MNPFTEHPSLTLLPEGAVYLVDSGTLVLADLHLGKAAAFRKQGLPVPEGDTSRDLGRVRALVEKCGAAQLVVAGDMFHAPSGITPELVTELAEFLESIGIPVKLVLGNHDIKLRVMPTGFESVRGLDLGNGVSVVHDPADALGTGLYLCGHLHPIVKIPDGKRTSLRFPCFYHSGNHLVLPAFGTFTGGAIIHPKPVDRVFVTLRDQVIELPMSIR